MTTLNDFKSNKVRYAKYISNEKSVYFDTGGLYPIISGDDQGVTVLDNNNQDYYIDDEEINRYFPITQEQFNEENKNKKIITNNELHTSINNGIHESIKKQPLIDFKDNTFPFWAKYMIISGSDISIANSDSLETATKIKALKLTGEDISIPLPVTKNPLEVLLELYQSGKITDDFLEKLVGDNNE